MGDVQRCGGLCIIYAYQAYFELHYKQYRFPFELFIMRFRANGHQKI